MKSAIYFAGNKFSETKFTKESKFEDLIRNNYNLLFGEQTFIIDVKKRIDTKTFGGAIPDFLLFDLSDKRSPEFYLVEVELARHDFYSHIFPQITKFFAFFKNPDSQNDLINKIFTIINNDKEMRKLFKKAIGRREIFKFLKDTVEDSQNVLLLIDDEKPELPEIKETYPETWEKIVQVLVIKEFRCGDDFILVSNPDFSTIGLIDSLAKVEKGKAALIKYTESYHLDNVSDFVRKTYEKLKSELLEYEQRLKFNPQKYYISICDKRNFAYIKLRKKKLRVVVMKPEEEVERAISRNIINRLSEPVQKFYGRPCCEVIIEKSGHLKELIDLLKSCVQM